MLNISPPFPAPAGWVWIFVASFYHVRAKRRIYAADKGKRAFTILIRAKRK